MSKFRGIFKGGLYLGAALTLMLSVTSCGKDEHTVDDYVVDDYAVESDSVSDNLADSTTDDDADNTADISDSDSNEIKTDGRSLTQIFGEKISANDSITVGSVNANFKINYQVPEAPMVNVYEGSFIENNSDIEKQIVNNFFGGTEQNLEEIKYVNDSDYIMLLYRYRSILMIQTLGHKVESVSSDDFAKYNQNIDPSFEDVYTWVDEDSYYIHMYEGEYNGNRYGMIYSYDKAKLTRNIFICPISMAEYFPDMDAKTMFVVDPQSNFGSENMCSMSETDVMNDASDVVEKFGLSKKNILLTANPNMEIPEMNLLSVYDEEAFTEMPKLVFADSDMMNAARKLNDTNPMGRTYEYKLLKEQQQSRQTDYEAVNLTENGYAVYLYDEPFSDKIIPQSPSTFNRGSILYTDKGLYSVDISLVAEIDNVVDGVQLLSFDEIKECFKDVLGNDPVITQKSSGSLEVSSVDFTYVLIEDEENNSKAKYVPAWYFVTKDKKLKSGEQAITYEHILNAMDGSDLKDTIK